MAKYEYKILKNIDEKANRVIQKLELQVPNSVEEAITGRQNFYVTNACFKDRRVFFKARIADHRVLRQWGKNFTNERRYLKSIHKFAYESKLAGRMPIYIKSQAKQCEWLMCEFIGKSTLGSSNISYDNPNKEDISEIINLILDIQSFPIVDFAKEHRLFKNLVFMDYERYHEYYHKFVRRKRYSLVKFLGEDSLDSADKIILKSKRLLNKNCTLFSHGDLHPANIILDNGRAVAIDWENLHVDNCAFDLATLWMRMIDHQEERRFFLLEYAKRAPQKDFPALFRLNLLCRIPEEIAMIWLGIASRATNEEEKNSANKILKICYSNYRSAINNVALEKYE
jgi:thiamine kinase-like enzyme